MNMEERTFTAQLGAHTITLSTGKLAGQAGGAVLIRWGDTVLLATATMSRAPREGTDFFPLTVDFEERLYAAGRIPGSFFRREGKPSENAILTSRLIDRPLRPLFPKDLRNEVQVVVTALSQDEEHQSDTLSIIGASAALMISDIPFDGPAAGVRVGLIDGELIVNPTILEMEQSVLDLRIAGSADAIIMVEAGGNEIAEATMVDALELAWKSMADVLRVQHEMQTALGKPKREYPSFTIPEALKTRVAELTLEQMKETVYQNQLKGERIEALELLKADIMAQLSEESLAAGWTEANINEAFEDILRDLVRDRIVNEGIRPDGRDPVTIRPLAAEVALLPRVHGSGLFTRGQTQVLSAVTLGMPSEEQTLDDLFPEDTKRYIHHYNFPPFSTGETGRLGSPRRREIGHGALAERALLPVIPAEKEFPYTIRVVSEVLSSNGSSSMASVCGSTLSLMDAGVPLKAPVAGIAMGLVTAGDKYRVLTDIQGMEDHLGDMDFKVAGTRQGITALQMDIKIKGVTREILSQALAQARVAREQILTLIQETMPAPRAELSPYAPRMLSIKINPDKIGAVIGPGGKNIRGLQAEFGVKIDIEEDGTVFIASPGGLGAEEARTRIQSMTDSAEVGRIYNGRVVRVTDFGAFIEILPGTDGMVHISQLSDHRVPSVKDVVDVGDEILVMVTDIDPEGKIRLSRRAVLEGWTLDEARAQDQAGRPAGGGGGGRRDGQAPRRR